jgi:hypothetical protein
VADIFLNKPDDFVWFIVKDFCAKEGFNFKSYKGEDVWQKGVGALTAPQFLKIGYAGGYLHLEAWIKNAILPGVYVGEMDLSGGYGFAVKKQLKKRVDALIGLLTQPIPDSQGYLSPDGTPYAGPVPVAVHNPTGKANTAFVLGIASLASTGVFLFLFSSLYLLIIPILGIVSAITGMKSTANGRALAGLIMSIISLVVSVSILIIVAVTALS